QEFVSLWVGYDLKRLLSDNPAITVPTGSGFWVAPDRWKTASLRFPALWPLWCFPVAEFHPSRELHPRRAPHPLLGRKPTTPAATVAERWAAQFSPWQSLTPRAGFAPAPRRCRYSRQAGAHRNRPRRAVRHSRR